MKTGFELDQGEEVVRRINHHWVDLFSLSTMVGVIIMVALALAYGLGRYRELLPPFITNGMVVAAIVALLLIAGLILIVGTWVYGRNYLLVTNQHLIQVEQRGLFGSQVDQVSLGRIQDVSGVREGFWPTVLGYGTVTVQSAGEQRQFIFSRVGEPQALADYILELHEQFLQDHPGSGGE